MIKYRLTNEGVQDTETMASIPADPTNRDWCKYQKWLKEGNIPDPMDDAVEIPEPRVIDGKRLSDQSLADLENANTVPKLQKFLKDILLGRDP